VLVSCAPFYSSSFGEYGWSSRTGSCLALLVGYRTYTILQALHSLIPLTIITVTSIWTFIFTHGFLKDTLSRQKDTLNTESFEVQKHIYSGKVLNLIGIFGSLLLFNVISWIPYLLVSVIGFALGFNKISNTAYASLFVLYNLTIVTNPLVQTYFRKELIESLKNIFCKCRNRHGNSSSAIVLSHGNKSESLRSNKISQKLKEDNNKASLVNDITLEASMPNHSSVKPSVELEEGNSKASPFRESYGDAKSDEAYEEDEMSLEQYSV